MARYIRVNTKEEANQIIARENKKQMKEKIKELERRIEILEKASRR